MIIGSQRTRQSSLNSLPPARALLTIRIIWFALMFGQVTFMAVIFLLILPNAHARAAFHPLPVLSWIPFAVLAIVVPVAFFMRRVILNRAATAAGVPPSAYFVGNIVFWAGCEGCAFFGLIAIMLNGSLWPLIVQVAIALFLQAFYISDRSRRMLLK